MTREEFFDKFELITELPDAVAKLRQLVLDLAVAGRLTRQDSADEAASLLLKRASLERSHLVASRRIKARRSVPLPNYAMPFNVPEAWAWTRLSDVGHELGQKVPSIRFTYIDVGSIDSAAGRISDAVSVLGPEQAPSRARKLVARGTVIYSTVRPYLRNIAIVDREFEHEPIASTAFGILHPFAGIEGRYLFLWLRSSAFTAYVEASMKGMAYPAINDESFYNGPIPLPPLAEQRRIVAKVDELMALCDQLETQQQERETRHAALARASLSRFAAAPTPANLTLLFHNSYTITPADLRKAILTMAVQGKLVAQEPDEGSGQELLDAVEEQKNRGGTVSGGLGIKKSGDAPSLPFTIPESWAQAPLGAIYESSFYGPRFGKDEYVKERGIPTVRTTDMTANGHIVLRDPPHVRIADEKKLALYRLRPNDLLLTRSGTIGTMAVFKGDYVAIPSAYLIRFRFPQELVADFYYLYLSSTYGQELLGLSLRSIGVPNVNAKSVSEFMAPLPPLREQRRIVAKVDQLMAFVDELETQHAGSRTTAAKLLDAIVSELTV